MRHQKTRNKLNRKTSHRKALLRNLATALFRHERIETTSAKARVLRPYAERLITMSKRGDLHSRRRAARYVQDHEVLKKLFDDLAERFRGRDGGYTRILKIGVRQGDKAPLSLIELVDRAAPAAAKADAEAEASGE